MQIIPILAWWPKTEYYEDTMLFGIAGPTAGGKTTVAECIVHEYKAGYLRYSDILASIASDRGLDPTDKVSLQGLYITLRKERGEGWLAEEIAEKAEDLHCEDLVIEGNRRKIDLETLRDVADRRNEKLVFVFVDATIQTRFKRYNDRLEQKGKLAVTWEDFEELESSPAENEVDDLRQYAEANGIYIDSDEYDVDTMNTKVLKMLQGIK